jgi:hypothetical protein
MDRKCRIGTSPPSVELLRRVDFEQHLFADAIIVVGPPSSAIVLQRVFLSTMATAEHPIQL